ncbi:MAG: phosphoenolpyruvate--protein phosphotransferase [Desulfovibrio sp.]|uniref:phosphoenolpyruvate--protein phosphotransferase n=1 Tax=Desulfovibrio sp. 7SRBS1 TaxID=3378064 RepID=UPI003B41646C
MIGIVVVSHSQKLAEGVLELAGQMTRGQVVMEAAGGIDDPDNPIGTDPMKVMAAIENVAAASEDGVLVLMDLGSALMSAETALDFLSEDVKDKVLLCSAPIVEGVMAAAVQASVGASLKEAAREANSALCVKIRQLAPITGEETEPDIPPEQEVEPQTDAEGEQLHLELHIHNKLGLHARPAANLVSTAGRFRSSIRIHKGEASASAKSINQVALLGVKHDDHITMTISGPDARAALDALSELHKDNFGERDEDVVLTEEQAVQATVSGDGTLAGAPASQGYASGPAYVHRISLPQVERKDASNTDEEIKRLDQAIASALEDIHQLRRQTEKTSGKANAAIFEAHALILGDQDMRNSAVDAISKQKINAEFAWLKTIQDMAEAYRNLDDSYMQARAADVMDCGARVLRILTGEEAPAVSLDTPSILVAHDLAPSDVAGMDADKVLGVVTEIGGATSHAAILSRSLGIPAVVGVGEAIQEIADGKTIALDGFTGTVWTAPDAGILDDMSQKRNEWLAQREQAKAKGAQPASTKDGRAVAIMGNIGNPGDADRVREYGAEGVGLFRTEFLFLDRHEAPDEEEQFKAYMQAAQAMQGGPVIIRTLDIGGDKPVDYLNTPTEANPFLGERGVRFCMARPELFRTQLRALLRAASSENIRIMFPMISNAGELAEVLDFLAKVRDELVAEGTDIREDIPTGIMIEVPGAVAVAEELATMCDFFSIGTNDLTQYVMAADRGNASVAHICDSLHPAVLRMISQTCQAATAASIEVGMCGEMAGRVEAVPLLLGLGLDELSMNAPAIPEVKETIRSLTMDECLALASEALEAFSADDVRNILKR